MDTKKANSKMADPNLAISIIILTVKRMKTPVKSVDYHTDF